MAGHITVRDPEFPDHFLVNLFGLSFRHMRVSDPMLVNHEGEVVVDTQPVNRSAFVIHAAVHQNHGPFTVGQTVEEAASWFVSMDRSCHAQLLAEAAGTPTLVAHDMAACTSANTGFPLAGWFSFQPLWQEICRTDPDLFD